jgi:vancomycin resistance protein YoaR
MKKKFYHTISILTCGFFLMPISSISASEPISFAKGTNPPSEINLRWENGSETIDEKTISRWLSHRNILVSEPGYSPEIENINICHLENPLLCDLLVTTKQRSQFHLSTKYSINEDYVKGFLEDFSKKTDVQAIDAKFKIEDGKVTTFSQDQKGRSLDIEKSSKLVIEALSKNSSGSVQVELPMSTTQPSVTSSGAEDLGIATLIGEGKSNFRGSTKNRIHNIKNAVERFNGVLIKPGEEFSFVRTLGDVDGENGYLPELVIKKDKTEPEFGGGICQVSTTVFRAAIYSGLKITARKNHAYPVSYYNPQGMDSTIYVPKPDLRFINNTPGHILIQSTIVGTELAFQFYGTNDGRKIEIDGPKIIEKNPDGSMKTTFTQKVIDAQNNKIIDDTFNSAYDSPDKYPHPIDPSKITEKPKDWSQKQWEYFKKTGLLPTN